MDALMVTLGLAEGRLELWALNDDPFQRGDTIEGACCRVW